MVTRYSSSHVKQKPMSHMDVHSSFFIMSRNWRQPECPLWSDRSHTMVCSHSRIWVDAAGPEVGGPQLLKQHSQASATMPPLEGTRWGMLDPRLPSSRTGKADRILLDLIRRVGADWGCLELGRGLTAMGPGDVLHLNCGDGYPNACIYANSLPIKCKLYL